MEEKSQEFGKTSITEVDGDNLVETTQSIVAGNPVWPRKIHTEKSVKIRSRADQDEEYIRFADEEERLQESGKLLEAEFQVRRTPAAAKSGARYAIKKFTIIDKGSERKV